MDRVSRLISRHFAQSFADRFGIVQNSTASDQSDAIDLGLTGPIGRDMRFEILHLGPRIVNEQGLVIGLVGVG